MKPHSSRIKSWSRRLTALAVLLVFQGVSHAEPVTLGAAHVDILNNPFTADETRKLVPFKQGDNTTRARIEETLSEINALDIVGDVDYTLTRSANGAVDLKITIVENRIVRQLLIGGNYPFLNKDFQRVMPMQPGTPYDPALIPDCRAAIDRFLVKHGFYGSRVNVQPLFHPRHNTVDLKVKIRKGKTYRVGEIYVSGNSRLRASFIRNRFNRFAHYSPVRLKSALKRIRNSYVKRGYIKARVKPDQIVFHDEKNSVDIHLSIKENKRLKLKFTGDVGLWRGQIKNVLAFPERRAYDRYAIQLGRKRLEHHFRESGYPDARVAVETVKTPDEIVVTYSVAKGQGVELAKIRFEGNEEFGDKKLKKHITSSESFLFRRGKYKPRQLADDARKIATYYYDKGYLDAVVEPPLITANEFGDHKYAEFPVAEGRRYRLGKISVASDEPFPAVALRRAAHLKKGEPIGKKNLQDAKTRVYERLFADGFAYAEVEFEADVNPDNGTMDLNIKVTRGPKVRLRSIVIKGNTVTRRKVILNNMKIRDGDVFVYQSILHAQQNLRRLGIFSTARIETLGFSDRAELIDLVVFVTELKSHSLNFQAGFDNRNLGRGEFSYTKRNLFGLAKQFNLRLIAGKKFDRAEATFLSPRVFGANWNLANQAFAQFEDAPNFNAKSYGAFVNTLKNFGPYWTFGLKEDVTNTDVIENDSNVALLGDALFDNTFNQFGAFIIYDRRDNFSDPRQGVYALIREELNTDLSDFKNTFNTVKVNLSHHQGFWERWTLNNTVRYGHNFKIAVNPRIPVNKLFFLGGADTLRGFSEDAVDRTGGTFYFLYNAELHVSVFDPIKIAGFFDAGVIGDNINEVRLKDFRESAGVGLRYFTPIGPLRLDWGFPLDRNAAEPASRVHFSFGYFF